jgi:catechol 2,3-dioxygenase-like lactoylglutathione lyase family enzyme
MVARGPLAEPVGLAPGARVSILRPEESLRAHHLALRVADPERAAAFYSGVLGLQLLRRQPETGSPRAIWLVLGDLVLMLERRLAGSGPEQGSGHLLALAVDDLSEWEERLAAAAVPIDGRSEWTLYCRDPDGHRDGLSTYPTGTTTAGAGRG